MPPPASAAAAASVPVLARPLKGTSMRVVLTLLLAVVARLAASQSTGVPTRLYKIPANYKARLEAFSTPSTDPTGADVARTSTPSTDVATTAAATTSEEPQRRRHIQLSAADEDTFAHGCDGNRECAESTKLAKHEEHPSSKVLLDRFMQEYQSMNGGNLPSTPDKESALAFLNEQLSAKGELEANPSNRLANLYLSNDFNFTDDKETRSKGAHWDEYPSSHHHHHSDEERDGWVTLEAVPWSQSKISKWYTDNKPHWSNAVQPSRPPQDWGSVERPPSWEERPSDWAFEKPSKPEHWYPPSDRPWPPSSRPHSKPTFQYRPSSHFHHDIVTEDSPHNHWAPHGGTPGVYKPWPSGDGEYSHTPNRPSNPSFHYDHHFPLHHDGHPPGHPENSDGEWVLVSNTKGYSTPHRYKNFKRALTFGTKPMTSTRSVRLTVLPDGNTTTSHGGLLEVQESFDTVEEDREEQERRKQLQLRPQNDPLPVTTNRYPNRVPVRRPVVAMRRPMMVARRPVAQQTRRRPVIVVAPGTPRPVATTAAPNNRGRAAMLAAVTAGVVPATMAVVVPAMMMGRRRRRRSTGVPAHSWQLLVRQSGKKGKVRRKVVRRRKYNPDVSTGHSLTLPPPHIRAAFYSLSH